LISFRDGVLLCQIGAVIHFIDAFGDERETLPARLRTTADNVFHRRPVAGTCGI
jgi:hypothetical protein